MEIETVGHFIERCRPELNSMKRKLGIDNQTYVLFSSAIATKAINALVSSINRTFLNGPSSTIAKYAAATMQAIGELDMDKKCVRYYNSNNETLRNIAGLPYARKKKPVPERKSVKESTSVSASADTSSNDDKLNKSKKYITWDKLIIGFIIAVILFIIIIFIQANNSLKHYEQEKNIDTLDTPVDQSVDGNYYNNYYNSGYKYEYEYENGSGDYDEYDEYEDDGGYSN